VDIPKCTGAKTGKVHPALTSTITNDSLGRGGAGFMMISDGHGSGLKLKEGTTYVKGVQALQWLRTRYGFEDNTDIARARAQHQYMNTMVRQLRENATLSSPNKLRKLAVQQRAAEGPHQTHHHDEALDGKDKKKATRTTSSDPAAADGEIAVQVEKSTDVSGMTLVVGTDWRSGTKYTAEKEDDTTPSSADAINGSDTKQCMRVNPDYTW